MNEKEKLQPKVRFREFTGENAPDWEQRKLGEVATLINGRAYKQNELLDQGKYRVLRVGNFNTNDRWYWSNLELEDNKYANKGELLYLWATNFGPKIWEEEKVIYHYHIWKVDYLSGSLEKKYLYTWLLVDKDKIMKDTNGSTMIHITKKNMEERKISIPVFEEQKCIGQFFEKVDKLITLHQRKLEQLEQLKNTLLSKMFPKSGTNIPEIRFSGFTDAWKQRKAKEIFITISEKGHIDLPVLSASQEFGMVERNNIGIDIKYDLNSIKNYKRVLPKQFVIHLRSFQGGFAWSTIEGITSPAYTVIDFIEKSNQDFGFWKIFLTSTNFIKKLETVTYGIRDGRSISFNDFSSMNFVIPNINEQERIGNLFQKIDNYIAIHRRKLEQLKNLKQTLLNKMFI